MAWIKLNATDPAPPAGAQNVHFRQDAAHLGTAADPSPVSAYVGPFTGDSGAGGASGLVPAPAAGDAAAGKVLKADGTWYIPPGGLTNPMTTQGDIIIAGPSGTPARLAAGTAGQVLQTNGSSAAPSWVTPTVGGGGLSISNFQLFDGIDYYAFPPNYKCTKPIAADFSWLFQPTGATETASGGQLMLTCPAGVSAPIAMRSMSLGAITTIEAAMLGFFGGYGTSKNPSVGIFLSESSTGKTLWFQFGYRSSSPQVQIWFANPANAWNTDVVDLSAALNPDTYVLLNIAISGGIITFSYSLAGEDQMTVLRSEAVTAHFTTGPDTCGYLSSNGGATAPTFAALLSWKTS